MPAVGTPEEIVDLMLDGVAQQLDDDEEISLGEVDGVAYGMIVGSDGVDTVVFYVEVRELDDDAILLTNLLAPEEDFDHNLLSATEEVEIDGEPIFLATDAADDDADDRDERSDGDRDDEDARNDERDEERDDEDEDERDERRQDDQDDDDDDDEEDDEDRLV
jgi:hypothetical protein